MRVTRVVRALGLAVFALAIALPAAAQSQGNSPYSGSVPQGEKTAAPIALTAKDALTRALQFNLALLLQEQSRQAAHGARWAALSDLLPHVASTVGEHRQVLNLEAYGFPAPDPIVGPFNVFDARVGVSQAVVDLRALNASRASTFSEKAAELGVKSARELVVLVSMDLYLEAVAAESRIEVVRAQQDTADALFKQAQDLKASGLVAGIDVVRAQLQVQNQRQRGIQAANDFAKSKLRLARAIGLPPGQEFTLVDKIPYAPLDRAPLEKVLADAYAQRSDYLAAKALVDAAEANKRAADSELLPTVRFDADFGTIGQEISNAHPTYSLGATVRIPLWEGGKTTGKRLEAEASLKQRQAEYDDLRGRIDMEVRSAVLDVTAATQQLDAARTSVDLASQELTQARDRFAAGVSGNLEVTQAQESLASASDHYIDALYAHNVAKATLARAAGIAEQAVTNFLGGSK